MKKNRISAFFLIFAMIITFSMPVFAAAALEECDEIVYINADNVNFRSTMGPGEANVIALLPKGTKLQRTAKSEAWSQVIRLSDGKKGFVSSQFLSAGAEPGAEPAAERMSTEGPGAAGAAAAGNGECTSADVTLSPAWKYADNSRINSGKAVIYKHVSGGNGITVCVNAGHGTKKGESVKTLCHPDGSPKVTGGSTASGATVATAVSSGTSFSDGKSEAEITLKTAQKLKEKLLKKGYNVLMIREESDVQLDNIARTVIANNLCDCHVAIHFDSTESDKGAYYCSVPNVSGYKAMEPVASTWQKSEAFGKSLIGGLKAEGVKIWGEGLLEMDLTQTSYSTIASVDIELGDRKSDHSDAALDKFAAGLVKGIDAYFGK